MGTGRTLSERSAAAEVASDKVSLNGYQPDMQHDVRAIPGAVDIVWPKGKTSMGCWALAPETLMRYASNRRVRRSGSFFEHLSDNQMALIDAGVLTVSETDPGVGPIELDPAQQTRRGAQGLAPDPTQSRSRRIENIEWAARREAV